MTKLDLTAGIAVDAAHSEKNRRTEYQGVDLATGEIVLYKDLGYKTNNVGEFLAIVDACKYIIEHNYKPKRIFSDSQVAISWFNSKSAQTKKRDKLLDKALIYLRATSCWIKDIEVIKWDNKKWGEIPADFGRK